MKQTAGWVYSDRHPFGVLRSSSKQSPVLDELLPNPEISTGEWSLDHSTTPLVPPWLPLGLSFPISFLNFRGCLSDVTVVDPSQSRRSISVPTSFPSLTTSATVRPYRSIACCRNSTSFPNTSSLIAFLARAPLSIDCGGEGCGASGENEPELLAHGVAKQGLAESHWMDCYP
jgi:hypothetical protein